MQAGVSISTVSRVVNTPSSVRTKTREEVYEAMKQLGYMPHSSKRPAESLNYVIAVFAPNLLLDSITAIIHAIEQELRSTPFHLLLVDMEGNRDFADFLSSHPDFRYKIDGAIVFSCEFSNEAARLMNELNIPTILMQSRSSAVHSISNNNFLGSRDAADYLIKCGYRQIAFIGWQPMDEHLADRYSGYQAALQNAGLPKPPNLTVFTPLTPDGGFEATRVIMPYEPDAIFYACDSLALGGLRWFREEGIAIPQEMGIMGFDDLSIANAIGLTTMHQFFDTKAKMAVTYLLGRINETIRENLLEELQITPRIVERSTTLQFEQDKTLKKLLA